jgi:hypothetical protein
VRNDTAAQPDAWLRRRGWRGGNLGLHIIRTADKIGN